MKVAQKDLLAVGGQILVVPNSTGIVGGVKAWDLKVGQLREPMSASGRPNVREEAPKKTRRPARKPVKKSAPRSTSRKASS